MAIELHPLPINNNGFILTPSLQLAIGGATVSFTAHKTEIFIQVFQKIPGRHSLNPIKNRDLTISSIEMISEGRKLAHMKSG